LQCHRDPVGGCPWQASFLADLRQVVWASGDDGEDVDRAVENLDAADRRDVWLLGAGRVRVPGVDPQLGWLRCRVGVSLRCISHDLILYIPSSGTGELSDDSRGSQDSGNEESVVNTTTNTTRGATEKPLTLAEKVWRDHLVASGSDGDPDLLYIDLHLVHEVTSPQAFDGLRQAGRPVRRPDLTIATEDHNVPTTGVVGGNLLDIEDQTSRLQVSTLRKNAEEFGIRLHSMGDIDQGIVHTVGPQLGLTQPGMTVVCGDSHTSTHGPFGSIAVGIGTSEVEHVLATQTLPLKPFKTMAIEVSGELQPGVSAKDLILAIIAKIGTGGGQGHIIEYRGEAIEKLSMEARMTICNMSIEAGARAGMVAPDQTTFDYLEGRPHAPEGQDWEDAVEYWKSLRTDEGAEFDTVVHIDGSSLTPFITWGTNPGQGLPLGATVP